MLRMSAGHWAHSSGEDRISSTLRTSAIYTRYDEVAPTFLFADAYIARRVSALPCEFWFCCHLALHLYSILIVRSLRCCHNSLQW
eukprot:528860-Pleurochrysis_carterae.AAC.2